jgi:hypothetical protein
LRLMLEELGTTHWKYLVEEKENRRRSESSLPSNVQNLPSRQAQLRIYGYVWWGGSWILSRSEQCAQLFTRDNVTNTEERKKMREWFMNYDLETEFWFGNKYCKNI